MNSERHAWHLDLGATVVAEGVRFRVWAPKCQRVEVVIEGERATLFPLSVEEDGYFSGTVPHLSAGALYRYRLDAGQGYPDPCARFPPKGPHGPSWVVDPGACRWQDADRAGISLPGQIIYELRL